MMRLAVMFKNSNKLNYILIAILEVSYKDLVLDSDEIQFGENTDVIYIWKIGYISGFVTKLIL